MSQASVHDIKKIREGPESAEYGKRHAPNKTNHPPSRRQDRCSAAHAVHVLAEGNSAEREWPTSPEPTSPHPPGQADLGTVPKH
ncbi:hypothetical protein GWI33_018963 [Rhynchophorus ferrugineus]|uniref:Uncharacterized protein n=1 Tax=Rhynchophorus ferrugineus TaxID=354439 RepID=A0A834M0X9_RHYFE|nr:hypothetical protein GWI33_018963 [Rhynchophorus ferrugineus]